MFSIYNIISASMYRIKEIIKKNKFQEKKDFFSFIKSSKNETKELICNHI